MKTFDGRVEFVTTRVVFPENPPHVLGIRGGHSLPGRHEMPGTHLRRPRRPRTLPCPAGLTG